MVKSNRNTKKKRGIKRGGAVNNGADQYPDTKYDEQNAQPVAAPPVAAPLVAAPAAAPSTNPENIESCKKKCNDECDVKFNNETKEKKGFLGFDFFNIFGTKNTADQKQGTTGGGKKRKSKSKSKSRK
jgi:hypothetical protein